MQFCQAGLPLTFARLSPPTPTTRSNRLRSHLQALLRVSLASPACGAPRMVARMSCFGPEKKQVILSAPLHLVPRCSFLFGTCGY
jgi:hypothetical protein